MSYREAKVARDQSQMIKAGRLAGAVNPFVKGLKGLAENEKKKQAEKQKKINKRKSINAILKNLPLEKGMDIFCKSHHRWYSNKGKLTPCKEETNCVLAYKIRYPFTQIQLF